MIVSQLSTAALRSLTARKDGPSLYDICDPILRDGRGGNPHLRKFYQTALGNPILRPLLRKAGLAELREASRFDAIASAIRQARDADRPDWQAIAAPIAALVDTIGLAHPRPKAVRSPGAPPTERTIDSIIVACGEHLLKTFDRHGFIPAYAAFNLIGDPDIRGRDFTAALNGLNAREYKNSTLLFNLARVFIARSTLKDVINPPWSGIAEEMWQPMQIRHRSAYYDAFFIEALLSFIDSGLASPRTASASRRVISALADFCLTTSREHVRGRNGGLFDVVTALAPPPHPRFSRFFTQIKQNLGFGLYVPDCDTTACSISAATQAGIIHPLLSQPMIDFYAGLQVSDRDNQPMVTVPLNDHLDYDGGIVTWIDNLDGDRPYGNDLDPTLNLDVLDACFRNLARWQIVETPARLNAVRKIIAFQRRLVLSGAFADPRSHIYYLPELYCAYFGRCYAAYRALPTPALKAIDPTGAFAEIRLHVLSYVQDELITREMNTFDAALALIALGHLGAAPAAFSAPLQTIAERYGEGGRRAPFKAYEWNKMKTPTRILVGGPEVTSAFVLMGLTLARRSVTAGVRPIQ